jgi:dihydroneopterin aldolase
MEFYGRHGVFAEERTLGQRFIVDATLYLSLKEAGASDDLAASVDYAEVYRRIKEIVEGNSFQLIEALAEHIASVLLDTYTKINEITVRVHKPHPPVDAHFAGVCVEIHRKRDRS